MTIDEAKMNRRVHLGCAFFGAALCLMAIAEAYLLYGQTTLFAWACGAAVASYWIERRMTDYARELRIRIRLAEQRDKLYKSLDNAFENVIGRTRVRHERERKAA